MPIESKLTKTTCPLCLYGCELNINAINRGDFITRKVEYNPQSAVNQGRLCARANMSTTILDHKNRLTSPLLNNKNIDWIIALSQIRRHLKELSPREIAICYDTNNTLEELSMIFSLAQDLKVDTIARTYLEPEAFFSYTPGELKIAELKDIERAKGFLIIGDVFSKSPVIAKSILNAKYADRNNRLFYIDSIKTKVAGFANKFVWVKPGTEPFFLLGLVATMGKSAKEMLGDKNFNSIRKELPKIAEICGITEKDIEEVTQSFSSIPNGVVLASIDYGKTKDPLLFSLLTQIVAMVYDKKFISPGLGSVPLGKIGIGTTIEQISQGKIKALVNFGEGFPFNYPQITPYFKNLDLFTTTTTFQKSLPIDAWILPVPSLLEKNGTINTLWGKDTVKPLAEPVNGSKNISEIIEQIAPDVDLKSKPRITNKSSVSIDEIFDRALNLIEKSLTQQAEFSILGEESAFEYRGLLENNFNKIKINRVNAQQLNVKNNELVKLDVGNTKKEYIVNITDNVPNNTAVISTNTVENRDLFPMQIDNLTKEIIIASTYGKLTKK
jgi:predicted molibdopterin-dependent oxidoreductase YjgC